MSTTIMSIIMSAMPTLSCLIVLGKQCTVRTIFCSLFYTCIIWLFEYLDIVGLINTAVGRVETIINPETGETVTGIKLFIMIAIPAMPPKVKSFGVWKK